MVLETTLIQFLNVILPHVLQDQDIFYILASLVHIQEIMLWHMLALIDLSYSSGECKLILVSIS